MRALPEVPEVLAFLVEGCGFSPSDAYATFNMGIGFAVYVAPGAAEAALGAARSTGHDATMSLGHLRQQIELFALTPPHVLSAFPWIAPGRFGTSPRPGLPASHRAGGRPTTS